MLYNRHVPALIYLPYSQMQNVIIMARLSERYIYVFTCTLTTLKFE